MLLKEIMTVYCKSRIKHLYPLCGKKEELAHVKARHTQVPLCCKGETTLSELVGYVSS
jgi:hypothetical protein